MTLHIAFEAQLHKWCVPSLIPAIQNFLQELFAKLVGLLTDEVADLFDTIFAAKVDGRITITISKLKQLHLQGRLASVHETLLSHTSLLIGPPKRIKVSITGGIQENNKGIILKGVNLIAVSYLLRGFSPTANYHRHFQYSALLTH